MALTRTFFGPHSAARLRTRWCPAAFEMPYAPITVLASSPPIEPTTMKLPPPRVDPVTRATLPDKSNSDGFT